MIKRFLTLAIRLYQLTIAVILPKCCRFYPSCSEYAIQSLQTHGPWRGGLKALGRICRCHPFNRGGYDPVDEYSQTEGS